MYYTFKHDNKIFGKTSKVSFRDYRSNFLYVVYISFKFFLVVHTE
jgi:hypothetical protein